MFFLEELWLNFQLQSHIIIFIGMKQVDYIFNILYTRMDKKTENSKVNSKIKIEKKNELVYV